SKKCERERNVSAVVRWTRQNLSSSFQSSKGALIIQWRLIPHRCHPLIRTLSNRKKVDGRLRIIVKIYGAQVPPGFTFPKRESHEEPAIFVLEDIDHNSIATSQTPDALQFILPWQRFSDGPFRLRDSPLNVQGERFGLGQGLLLKRPVPQ